MMFEDGVYQQIGKNIRTIRQQRGLNQDDLAKLLQLSRASISNMEQGRHRIQIHVLYQIAMVLQTTVPLLLSESERESFS